MLFQIVWGVSEHQWRGVTSPLYTAVSECMGSDAISAERCNQEMCNLSLYTAVSDCIGSDPTSAVPSIQPFQQRGVTSPSRQLSSAVPCIQLFQQRGVIPPFIQLFQQRDVISPFRQLFQQRGVISPFRQLFSEERCNLCFDTAV